MFRRSTTTLPSSGSTRVTLPDLPRSRPATTSTLSPFRIFLFNADDMTSQHLGGERNDLHESLRAELASDRPEDAGTDRLVLVVDEDSGIVVEADVRAVGAADLLRGANDH